MSGTPEGLLRGALEKIVFFECRVDQLQAEVAATRAAAARARDDAASSRRREAELESALAKARAGESAATSERAELCERVRLLEAERERFLTGLVERARVSGAPSDAGTEQGETADLAGFIAELRAEIETLRAWKRAAEAAGVQVDARGEVRREGDARPAAPPEAQPERRAEPRLPEVMSQLAERFERDGRIGVNEGAARGLSHGLTTRSERALYESALDDLAASDPATRRRAAERLRALGAKAAAPLVAAAIGREPDAGVKAALLAALGALAEPSAADLAVRELADARPPVRAAALDALFALAREDAVPQLSRSLEDAAPLVRRRAALLLGFCRSADADEALAAALHDRDGGVARAAAVALAGRPNSRAQAALARAVASPRAEVRRSAARAVGRWAGDGIATAAAEGLDAVDRRAVARKLAERLRELDPAALRGAVASAPGAAAAPAARASATARATAAVAASATRTRTGAAARTATVTATRTATATTTKPATTTAVAGELASAVLAELRTALRGRTPEEIAESLAAAPVAVDGALRALVAEGALVARGAKFYAA